MDGARKRTVSDRHDRARGSCGLLMSSSALIAGVAILCASYYIAS
jgi:hypothetical protein